jgi:putative MATE family efflux protein
MLQCSGDMKTPSILMTVMCFLDVVFNFFLIFPSRTVSFAGMELWMPGAGLGVLGAQLGTSLSVLVTMIVLLYCAAVRSEIIRLANSEGSWLVKKDVLQTACSIGIPMALENSALSMAQIVSTRIIAPLGTAAIAAHSFAITAESICYMPGYGISSAATTLVGQAIGAERKDLACSFGWLSVFAGMAVMTLTGAAMYVFCPYVFEFLTPVIEVQLLGARVLRYELLAEPLFAASIVATGALRGAGDTLVPGIMNLISMWGIRLTLAWLLSRSIGLDGVWIAMAIELSCRGIIFLIRLKREKWLK